MHARWVSWLAALVWACGCDQVFDLTAPPDPGPVRFVVEEAAHAENAASLTYQLTIPDGSDRALVVAVSLSSDCSPPTPTVTRITYAGAALTRIVELLGTPCAVDATRSEQWLLVAPAVGGGDVVVTLSEPGPAVHSGAIALAGVDPSTPVRDAVVASGSGAMSTVTVSSADGDLVVNTVGQGTGIIGPSGDAMVRYVQNVDDISTLNNTAGSTTLGHAPSVTSTWMFVGADQWQTISTSLQPARL